MSKDTERTRDSASTKAAPPAWANLSGVMEVVVKVVAIGFPLLYATGRIYSEAYWGELQIPSSLLGYSAEDYLYLGFVAMAIGLANAVGVELYSKIGYVIAIALAMGATVVAGSLLASFIRRRIAARVRVARRYVQQAREALPGEAVRHMHAFGAVTSVILALLLGTLGLVLFVLLPIALVHRAGKNEGVLERQSQETAETYREKSTGRASMHVHYRVDGAIKKARLVECGKAWCVLREAGGFAAIPSDDVVRVDQEPASSRLGAQGVRDAPVFLNHQKADVKLAPASTGAEERGQSKQ